MVAMEPDEDALGWADPGDAWPRVCAAEFRGREFSCRPIPAIVSLLRQQGIQEDEVFAGIGYPRTHLLDVGERIDWLSAQAMAKNLAARLSDAQLERLGSDALRSRPLRFLTVIGRLLMRPPEFYRFAARELTRYCACLGAYVREIAPSEIQLHVLMEPGYPPVRELFLALRGALRSMTEVYGRRSAVVHMEELPGGVIYRIELPGTAGLLGLARRLVRWGGTMRAAARDLREANELLHRRSAALLRLEHQLDESERRYRTLLECALDPMWIIDSRGRIRGANGRSADAFGVPVDGLVGRLPSEFLEISALKLRDFLLAIGGDDAARTEALARRPDGSAFPVEIFCFPLEAEGFQVVLVDVRERKRAAFERARLSRELDARVSARTAELERINDQLRREQSRIARAERIRALEQVSSKLSAALNPAVRKLIDTLEGVASMETLRDGGIAQGLALAHEISSVVETALSQIGVDGAARRTVERPREILQDALQELALLADAQGVRIAVTAGDDLPSILVDRGLFAGALIAVGTNAIEAMDSGATLSISIEEASSPHRLMFRILDEGDGIPPELRQRVLEPHFSTKPGRAGLGLPLALGVVQGHGGGLEIFDRDRSGCEVRIVLPLGFAQPRMLQA